VNIQSETIGELTKALLCAQARIKHAVHDSKNPHFKNNYASLEAVIDTVKSALNENKIIISQPMIREDGQTYVVTQLIHESGQWLRSYTPVLLDKDTAQGQGSGISYARRYGLESLLCIGSQDDDGNQASGLEKKPEAPPVKQSKITTAGDFVVPFGKNKGKRLDEIKTQDLSNLIGFIKGPKADAKFKESQGAKEFLFWSDQYLKRTMPDELDIALGANTSTSSNEFPPDFEPEPWPDER